MRDLHTLKTFAGENVFHVVVESPRGSAVKLKYSPALGAMSISRPLVLGVTYPCDFGFVPSTEGPDRDPIDAAIWWDVTTYPGVVQGKQPRILGWDDADAALELIRSSAT